MATFSDTQLIQIVIKAARRVNRKLCLTGTVDEIIVSAATGEITAPDNADLEDIVLLQAECMITQRHFVDFLDPSSAAAGVLVKDGEQAIDTRAAGSSRAGVFSSSISPCEELKTAIKIQKMNQTGDEGKMVW